MKNKLLVSLLVGTICFGLVGCGTKTEPQNSNSNQNAPISGQNNNSTEYQGATKGGNGLKNVSTSNYKDVAKDTYGVDIKDETGWAVEKAESPNGVNNLKVNFKVTDGSDGKEIIKQYFEQTKALSGDGVYSYGMNDSYTAMVKGDKYVDFDAYFSEHGTSVYGLYSAIWIYSYNDKTVQFAINVNDNKADITLTLMG